MTEVAERIPTIAAARRRRPSFWAKNPWAFPLALALPAFLVVFGVVGYPWVYSGWMSLNDVNWYKRVFTFVGLQNYVQEIPNPDFQAALVRTAYLGLISVVGATILGLLIALVLNERFKGRGFLRSAILLPWAMAEIIVGYLWLWIYAGDVGGLNAVLTSLGVIHGYVTWLAEGFLALNLAGIVFIWHVAPLSALLLLAGLQSIPPNLYNAAKVDGAGPFQRFFAITFPWLRSMLLLSLILVTIGAITEFDLIYALTRGGPGTSTTVFSWFGYQRTFIDFRFGEGSAILYTLSLISLVLAVVYMLLLYRREVRGRETGLDAFDVATRRSSQLGSLVALQRRHAIAERPRVRKKLVGNRALHYVRRTLLYLAVIAIAAWSLLPFLWLILASLKDTVDLISKPPNYLPIPPMVDNYITVLGLNNGLSQVHWGPEAAKLLPGLINSTIVAVSVTAINLVIGSFAGYAYARQLKFWFMRGSLLILLISRMVPGLVLLVPFFILFQAAGLFDSKTGLVIAYSAFILPLTIWIMKGYFETVPKNIESAAKVDGCTWFTAFTRVFLPVSRPGLIAAAIFCFIVAWNEFLFALILTSSTNAQTVTIVLAGLAPAVMQRTEGYGQLFAAGVLAVLPPVLIALFFQKYLIQGMLSGSSKG